MRVAVRGKVTRSPSGLNEDPVRESASVVGLEERGIERLDTPGLGFRDPWGNRIQVVAYEDVQFTKSEAVLEGMGLELGKSESAREELREKGMGP